MYSFSIFARLIVCVLLVLLVMGCSVKPLLSITDEATADRKKCYELLVDAEYNCSIHMACGVSMAEAASCLKRTELPSLLKNGFLVVTIVFYPAARSPYLLLGNLIWALTQM